MQLTKQDVRAYFTEVVLCDYARFIEGYLGVEVGGTDLRLAQKSAESLLHLGDRLFLLEGAARPGIPNPTEYRRVLFRGIPMYAVVSDVALAAKHCVVRRGEGVVRDESAMRMFIAIDRYADGEGAYLRFRKLLEVTVPNGQAADFGELLYTTVAALAGCLVELKVLPGLPELKRPAPHFVERATHGRTPVFRMVGRVGDRGSYGHKVFFYREKLGRLTPGGMGDELGCAVNIRCEAEIAPSIFSEEQDR